VASEEREDPQTKGLPYGGAHITHVVASTHVCCLQAIASPFFFFILATAPFSTRNLGQQSQPAHMCNHVQGARSPVSSAPQSISCPAPTTLWRLHFAICHWRFAETRPLNIKAHAPLPFPGKLFAELEFRKRASESIVATWSILKRICLVSNGSASGWRMLFQSTKSPDKIELPVQAALVKLTCPGNPNKKS